MIIEKRPALPKTILVFFEAEDMTRRAAAGEAETDREKEERTQERRQAPRNDQDIS